MYAKAKEIPYELFDKRNIAEASAVPEYTVTGFNRKAHTPSVSITYGEDVLLENTDFTLEYTNNTEAGTATITVTGCGDYKGAQILEFAIKNILGDGSVDAVDVTVILRYLVRIKVNDPDRVALAGNVTRSGVGYYRRYLHPALDSRRRYTLYDRRLHGLIYRYRTTTGDAQA